MTYEILSVAFAICVVGYFVVVMTEKKSILNNKFNFKSKIVTQGYLDSLDMLAFKLGKIQMNIGDEIRVTISGTEIRGTILGARKRENSICILEKSDKIKEIDLNLIDSIRITRKYGRLF